MAIVLFLIFTSFVVLYLIPKGRDRKGKRLISVSPMRLMSGDNPFEQFALTNRERAQRVGFLS